MRFDIKESLSRLRPRWIAAIVLILSIAGVTAWNVRPAYWPCGALDRTSGCVQRVKLDLAAVGLDPATAKLDSYTFDLGPEGKLALISARGPGKDGWRGVLATFDARTGHLVTLIAQNDLSPQSTFQPEMMGNAAFSPDGTRIAADSEGWGGDDGRLTVTLYDTASGAQIATVGGQAGTGACDGMLDFSPDGTKLQCFLSIYDLASDEKTRVELDGSGPITPFADFPPGNRAPDGTVFDAHDLPSGPQNRDTQGNMHFAPDSVGVLEVWSALFPENDEWLWTPSMFQKLSAVGVWDGKTKALKRQFFANERYVETAWARDMSYFGFVSNDFHLTLFRP